MTNEYKASPATIAAVEAAGLDGGNTELLNLVAASTAREIQAKVEDHGVRSARANSWCGVFSATMSEMFPDGPLDGEDWRDSDGVACNGSRWHDADGYGRNGLNDDGYDRDGFDKEGRDADEFDRAGLDRNGIHRDDPAQYRYDAAGYDREGFNRNGRAIAGLTRAQQAANRELPDSDYRWNSRGYDAAGFNGQGYNSEGFNAEGFDRYGIGLKGVDRNGFDGRGYYRGPDGTLPRDSAYDPAGFDRSGYHSRTGSMYGEDGYDRSGRNRSGEQRPVPADSPTS